MSFSLSVSADQGKLAEDTFVSVEVLSVSSNTRGLEGMIMGQTPLVLTELEAGQYVVRVRWPNGAAEQKVVDVPAETRVAFTPEVSSNEDLNIFRQTRRQVYSSITSVPPSSTSTRSILGIGEARGSPVTNAPTSIPGAARVWDSSGPWPGGRFGMRPGISIPLTPYSDGGGSVIGRYNVADGLCLEVHTPSLQRWLALPGASIAAVFLQPDSLDGIGISVSSENSRMESLMSFLVSRSPMLAGSGVSAADSLMEIVKQAESDLHAKFQAPTSAVVGAYVLLRTGNLTPERVDWLQNLAFYFQYPDSYLMLAKYASIAADPGSILSGTAFQQAPPDLSGREKVVVWCISQAFSKGPFPLFTEGYVIFQELLHFLEAQQSTQVGASQSFPYSRTVLGADGSTAAVRQIDLLPVLDWKARYTAFRYETMPGMLVQTSGI